MPEENNIGGVVPPIEPVPNVQMGPEPHVQPVEQPASPAQPSSGLTNNNVKVLIVDDDESYLTIFKMALQNEGINADSISNPVEALGVLKSNKYDLILLDFFMPEMTGEAFVEQFRTFDDKTPIILQTGYADESTPMELLKRIDIQGYFDKTKGLDNFIQIIAMLVKTIAKCKKE